MALLRLFAKQETAARHAVLHRQRIYRHGLVLKYPFVNGRVKLMKSDGKSKIGIGNFKLKR